MSSKSARTSARRKERVRAAACAARARCPASSTAAARTPVNIELDHNDAVPAPEERDVPRVDPRPEARRREAAGAAARRARCIRSSRRCCTSTSSASSKDKKIHMKVPLHFVNAEKSPGVKEQGGVVNHVHERARHHLPAGGPAGVHRGRSVATSPSATRCTCATSSCRRASSSALHKGENPVVATVVDAASLDHRGRGSRCRRRRGGAVGGADHRAGRAPKEGEGALPRARRATSGKARRGRRRKRRRRPRSPPRPTRARRKRRSKPCDPPHRRPRQSRAGVRAHAPQRRLLVGRALRRGQAASRCARTAKFQALVGRRDRAARRELWLLKPQTLHERERPARCSARRASSRSSRDEILVVHDELDFAAGRRAS